MNREDRTCVNNKNGYILKNKRSILAKSSCDITKSCKKVNNSPCVITEETQSNGSTMNTKISLEMFPIKDKESNEIKEQDSAIDINISAEEDDFISEPKQFKLSLLSRGEKMTIVCVSVVCLLGYLSLSVLAPFFPKEADKKNVDGAVSGWIFGVVALVKVLVSPLAGRIIPKVGSKTMLLSGIFMCGVFTLCFGVLDRIDVSEGNRPFIVMCFLVRILLALGCSAISTSSFVVFVQAFPDNVTTVFGIVEIFTGVGLVMGPALGGFLYDVGGFILPFAVIGISCLLAFPLVWITMPALNETRDSKTNGLSLWKVATQPKAIVNSIVIALGAADWSVLDPTLEPHMRVYGFNSTVVGLLFLIVAAVYSVTSPILGMVADKLPDNRVLLIPGFILGALGFLFCGPSPTLGFHNGYNSLVLTAVSLAILGLAASMCIIPTFDIYMDVLSDIGYPENTRSYSMVSGLWVCMYALGEFCGPSLGGYLNEKIGFEWLTTVHAASCILTSLLVFVSWTAEWKFRKKKTKISEIEEKPLIPNGKREYFD